MGRGLEILHALVGHSREKSDTPPEEKRKVVVFDPETQTTGAVEVSATNGSSTLSNRSQIKERVLFADETTTVHYYPSRPVDSTWNGKFIHVYCDDLKPTPPTTTHYNIFDGQSTDSNFGVPLGTIEVNKYWRQGTERMLYFGKIPAPLPS